MLKSAGLVASCIMLSSVTSLRAQTYCMWTIKASKGKSEESFMKAPCEQKNVAGANNSTVVFVTPTRQFRIEYLGQPSNQKQKVKINGKIGTATEENRVAFTMTTDDLSIEFSYDDVVPDKKYTTSIIQGTWSKDGRSSCKNGRSNPSIMIINGSKLSRYAGESECSMYSVGKSSTSETGMVLAKCQNEEESIREIFSFQMDNGNKEMYWEGTNHYYKCSR